MDKKNIHLALTGAGTFLCQQMLRRVETMTSVASVHIFDIKPPKFMGKKAIFHKVDLTKDNATELMSSALKEHDVSIFVHGALFSLPGRTYSREVETIGTFHVLNAIANSAVKRLIVHSATFVYGAHPKNPNFLLESSPLRREGGPSFVRARVDVEQQIQDFAKHYPKTAVAVLRFCPIMGPNSNNLLARYFIAGVVPSVMGYDPLLQFIHEEDAIRAQLSAVFSDVKGTFNIVGKGVLPLTTAVHLAGRFAVPVPAPVSKLVFGLGYSTRLWNFKPDLASFFQYLCVAEGSLADKKLGFRAQYSSRQALKSMLESVRLRRGGFAKILHTLGEEKSVQESPLLERVQ